MTVCGEKFVLRENRTPGLYARGAFNRQSTIGNRKSIDSLALSGLPVHFAGFVTAQLTHLPPSETRIGSSSIMYWVFPMAPIMRVPVAANHFFDMLSPVKHPQALQYA
jgi:hypothetical protein